MPWKKDGIEFVNPLHWQGKVTYNPTAAMLVEAGYEWEEPVPPPPPPPNHVYTKRKIRLAMRKMGIEEKLNAMLSIPEIALAWNEAQDIDLENADFKAAFAASTVTEEELAELRRIIDSGEVELSNGEA